MSELVPAPFADLVTRLFLEPRRQDALFELPRRKWYLPRAPTPDLSVRLHGRPAGNPSGPAAGPHTQMAQNIVLSYVAGGRILELKTVQVNDRLTIARPCIDMTNVGYNVEWSQELRIEDSLREYVAGAMLVEMFRRSPELTGGALDGPAGDVIYDLSVGYDLAGIRSEQVAGFLRGMRDASAWVEKLRAEIPREFAAAREWPYLTQISSTLTLSTFHGCPADEIERICEHLIDEHELDVVVKMNPPTLGREKLEHLLHDVMGYRELTVNPTAYDSVISLSDSVELCRRLRAFAAARGRSLGFKFSNTLEVLNHRQFFSPDQRVMYLSGQPLHVITMALTDEFRRAVGADVPISFSAGIDRCNFPYAVACGFVPVTVSTDLLRPGGYGRLPSYLDDLAADMRRVGAATIDEYIMKWSPAGNTGHSPTCPSSTGVPPVSEGGGANPGSTGAPPVKSRMTGPSPATADPTAVRDRSADPRSLAVAARVGAAAVRNTSIVAQLAREDPRYRAARNRAVPKRIDSHLTTFDCITCDKCLPVCPNAANFLYPTPPVAFEFHDLVIEPGGRCRAGERRRFEIAEPLQIACYADFCNECGNCDTFCPEYGGPYIKKPTFFGSVASWQRAAPRDGFVVERRENETIIRGRMQGKVYRLSMDRVRGRHRFEHGGGWAEFDDPLAAPLCAGRDSETDGEQAVLDMWAFHVLRHLLAGVLDGSRVNQVNVAFAGTAASRPG
ncbi:MAG: glutamate synthase [Phycisphaerae bacterium]